MYAHVNDLGVVDFVMAAEPSNVFGPPYSLEFVFTDNDAVTNGWKFNGDQFIPPDSSGPPRVVSMRQARLALLSAGLLDDIDTAIASIPGDDGRVAKIQWEYATEVRRDNPLIAIVQQVQGLTDAQIDALFLQAAKL